jgi:hypothetical protein
MERCNEAVIGPPPISKADKRAKMGVITEERGDGREVLIEGSSEVDKPKEKRDGGQRRRRGLELLDSLGRSKHKFLKESQSFISACREGLLLGPEAPELGGESWRFRHRARDRPGRRRTGKGPGKSESDGSMVRESTIKARRGGDGWSVCGCFGVRVVRAWSVRCLCA